MQNGELSGLSTSIKKLISVPAVITKPSFDNLKDFRRTRRRIVGTKNNYLTSVLFNSVTQIYDHHSTTKNSRSNDAEERNNQ